MEIYDSLYFKSPVLTLLYSGTFSVNMNAQNVIRNREHMEGTPPTSNTLFNSQAMKT